MRVYVEGGGRHDIPEASRIADYSVPSTGCIHARPLGWELEVEGWWARQNLGQKKPARHTGAGRDELGKGSETEQPGSWPRQATAYGGVRVRALPPH